MAEAAIEGLRKALKKKVTDRFEVGTVIRWLAAGRYNYAAIKTEVGWFTTARGYDGNGMVAKCYEYEDLIEMLSRAEVTGLSVATAWEAV